LSENEKKRKKPLKGTGGSLAGSAIAEDKDEEDEDTSSGAHIVTSFDIECPSCHLHFTSDTAFNNHLPCKQE